MVTIIKGGMMIKLPLLIIFWFMLSTCLYSLIAKLIRMNREGEMTYFKCYPTSYQQKNDESCALLFSPTAAIFFAIGSILFLLLTFTCLSIGSECIKVYKLLKESPRSINLQRSVAENYTVAQEMEVTSISSETDLNQTFSNYDYKDDPPNYDDTLPPLYEDAIKMTSQNKRY